MPLAIAAHLGLFYSVLILYCSESDIPSALASTRALAGLQVWTAPNFLAAAILLLSLMSSVISHREYWQEIKGARTLPLLPSGPGALSLGTVF